MSSKKLVTSAQGNRRREKPASTAQGDCVVMMANQKGYNLRLFQQAIDDRSVSLFLDQYKEGTFGLVAPLGARIHTMLVRVKLDSEWNQVIGPDVPGHYPIKRVGHLYKPTGRGEVEHRLVLINYPLINWGCWDVATKWADDLGLKRTDPRYAFAVPNLCGILGLSSIDVVATKDCVLDNMKTACGVFWNPSSWGPEAKRTSGLDGPNEWFAFEVVKRA